jgi:hypothetical protein
MGIIQTRVVFNLVYVTLERSKSGGKPKNECLEITLSFNYMLSMEAFISFSRKILDSV